jgi:two-component system chemotaxis sensor kinase CheA
LAAEGQKQRLLLFKSGSFERLAVPLALVARLEEVAVSSIEHAGGRTVVQYRGHILPLINLAALLDSSFAAEYDRNQTDPLQVIVFSNGDNTVGLVVDQIVDIVEEAVTMRRPASPKRGILGSAVIGRKVADFLDLQAIIESTGERFFGGVETRSLGTVLLAEPSAFNRGLLRSQLEMSGYDVLEASTASEALLYLERESVQIFITGSDLLAGDPAAMSKVRKRTLAAGVPVLALSNTEGEISAHKASGLLADDYQLRFERESMLKSLARLAQAINPSKNPHKHTGSHLAERKEAGELINA